MAEIIVSPQPHILIVDHIETVGFLPEEILISCYAVTRAINSFDALSLLENHAFDLVLTSRAMPGLDGLQLLKRIRQNEATAHLPVIFVAAAAQSEDIAHALEMGADDYLTQPVERRELLARIHRLIEHKQQADAQRQIADELHQLKNNRDQFFRMASHDLKNPMNQIRIAEFLLRSTLEEDLEADDLLDTIEDAVATMEEIIGEFLEASTLQNQSLTLKHEKVVVEDILWEGMIQHSANAQKREVILRFDGAQGAVCGDPQRLAQAVSNLVSRAIRYSPAGSTVALSAEHRGPNIRINIHDTAPGISALDYACLFMGDQPAFPAPTEEQNREGLGLWTARRLIEMQQGRFGLDRLKKGGSIFWLEMPVWSEKRTAEPQLEAS